jgi:hypothetical protein
VRRKLNLFQGQLLNWDIYEDEGQTFIRLFTGGGALPAEHAAFQDLLARKRAKEKGAKCGTKIGKSAKERARRLEAWKNPARFESTELRNLVSNLSQYLLALQARLSALPGD